MAYNWTKLPLYDSWDYDYTVPVNGLNLTFRIHYSDRTKTWTVDLSHGDGVAIVLGEALLPYKEMLFGVVDGITGFLWMEAVSSDINEAVLNPDRIDKYYNLYYIYR